MRRTTRAGSSGSGRGGTRLAKNGKVARIDCQERLRMTEKRGPQVWPFRVQKRRSVCIVEPPAPRRKTIVLSAGGKFKGNVDTPGAMMGPAHCTIPSDGTRDCKLSAVWAGKGVGPSSLLVHLECLLLFLYRGTTSLFGMCALSQLHRLGKADKGGWTCKLSGVWAWVGVLSELDAHIPRIK